MTAYQFTPGGVEQLGEAKQSQDPVAEAMANSRAILAIKPQEQARPAPAPMAAERAKPAPKAAPKPKPRSYKRELKARLKEVRRQIKLLQKFQDEADELKRLIAALEAPAAAVRNISTARKSS